MKWNIFKRSANADSDNPDSNTLVGIRHGNGLNDNYTKKDKEGLSVVARCIDCVSDGVAKLPVSIFEVDKNGYKKEAFDYPSYACVTREPNPWMSTFTFLKMIVSDLIGWGNGYAYIHRDWYGHAIGMELLRPGDVTVVDDQWRHIKYYQHPKFGIIERDSMLHVVNYSNDGEHGISTLKRAANTLGLSLDAEKQAKGFFESGGNLSGIVSVAHTLTKQQKKDFYESWYAQFNPTTGHPNGIALLEAGSEYHPVSVNPADAQLLETRRFSVEEICRFFGVSPVMAYDLTKSSYSTIEATQLSFLTDTIQPLIAKLEMEMDRKLFLDNEKGKYEVKFDTSKVLRIDKAAQANYLARMYQIGVYTTNEIRKSLDMQPVEGGDKTFVQSNLVDITKTMEPKAAQQQPNPNSNGSNNQKQDDPEQK